MADTPIGNIQLDSLYTAPTATNLGDRMASVISNAMTFVTLIAGLGLLFYFLIGAVNWLVSGGDPQKIKAAQDMMLNAFVGIVIVVIAYPAISILGNLIGIPISNPVEFINQLIF